MRRWEVILWCFLVAVIGWGSAVTILAKFLPLSDAVWVGFRGTGVQR